ncbi:MAG TPA: guanitoxin biosynthesis heme-dependent pre-guanitoxin N-hydroxylase GntA, partial [Chryseosolibacter sp.]
MVNHENDKIISEFMGLLADKAYPCVAARAAMSRNHLSYLVLGDLRCPADDRRILKFIYEFTGSFRSAQESFHSAVIIFRGPRIDDEKTFDDLLWAKLQSLSALDAENFRCDKRVSSDPRDAAFSFSLGEEGFFIIGLHPASSRPSRRFSYPALVFNPHEQFEVL